MIFGLAVILLILSFLPVHRFLPTWSNHSGDYDLGPGNVNGPTVYLFYGSIVDLDVSISGANKDVFFYITDSEGDRILDAGTIYDGYHLEWEAPTIGSFRFHFSNTMSWVSHKYVTWSYTVSHYKGLFLILAIGLLILGIGQMFREERVIPRIKGFLFKEPEPTEVECEYCGTIYSKTLHKCPTCGALRKRSIPREKRP